MPAAAAAARRRRRLSADPNAELSAVADIDEAIVERASQRLKGSEKFGARVKIDKAFFGLDAYDKVINSGVDVVLLATPPGFRPQHLTRGGRTPTSTSSARSRAPPTRPACAR